MAHTIAFDTLTYAKKLRNVGFTEEQAETQASALASLVDDTLASKRDLKESEGTLKRDLKELETTLKRDLKELETTVKGDMKELEMRLTIRLGAMMTAGITIVAILVKLL